MNIKLIESESADPWRNLALEEYLLKTLQPAEIILYLWQNDKTVVIGANQNPWKECNLKLLEEDGGKIARRISGGGAVYHDLGNLNFTFLADRQHYNFARQLKIIVDALAQYGINAEFEGRNDIVVKQRKLSGNAFYFDGDKALHHGTILLDCDLSKMTRYLQVSDKKIQSKGIDSVRSRVINLTEIIPEITIEALKDSLKEQFRRCYGPYEQLSYIKLDHPTYESIYNKQSSWDWRFGETPEYQITFANYFSWGELSLGLTLDKGLIQQVKVYSDAMEVRLADDIKELLLGLPLDTIVIRKRYRESKFAYQYHDIIDWLIKEIES